MKFNSCRSCFLCGSTNLLSKNYLGYNSNNVFRNIAYLIPDFLGNFFSYLIPGFISAYRPVLTNKRYFTRHIIFCRNCLTGWAHPYLSCDDLSAYYTEFYWRNRDSVEGSHLPKDFQPNLIQLEISKDRFAWINQFNPRFSSIIDFGAGDCAFSYYIKKNGLSDLVHVVDPSKKALYLSAQYGASYSRDIIDAPIVDFIYSAHSIEHVYDLLVVLELLIARLREGGHIFIETPNIGDELIFQSFTHTPHTFLLSMRSFEYVASIMGLSIIAMECTGPPWKDGFPSLRSQERADLRILLKKDLQSQI